MCFLFKLGVSMFALLCAAPRAFAEFPREGRALKGEKSKVEKMSKPVLNENVELLIKYKNGIGRRKAKKLAKDGNFDKVLGKHKIAALHASNKAALKALMEDPNIEHVEIDAILHSMALRASEKVEYLDEEKRRLEEQIGYGIKMVQADQMWAINRSPPLKISVCIVDTGYALGHSDLPALKDKVTGTSTSLGEWSRDPNGHGTHVAGIIGATGNNGLGVVGVNKDPNKFSFHIVKGLSDEGEAPTSMVLDNVDKCIEAGSKVISMSLGANMYSASAEEFYKQIYDQDVLLVAAAGNDGDTSKAFPASFPHVISVGAVDMDGHIAGYSQHNDQVEIAGPGSAINSTDTDETGTGFIYKTRYGTSMAAPFVAGVAAMVWSYFPECSNNQIRNVLLQTARDTGPIGCDEYAGYGIVQAKAAYDLLQSQGCAAGDASPSPLSEGAIGGCSQNPQYVPPPTMPPTAFVCNGKDFMLELTTDNYNAETSWELLSYEGIVVSSGGKGDYLNAKTYTVRKCLLSDEYTFIIRDAAADGICCSYGLGGYSVYYDGELIKTGGEFKQASESVTFGTHSTTPKIAPFSASPTLQPSSALMQSPTNQPTDNPTTKPSPNPTVQPTLSPTPTPSLQPTPSPLSVAAPPKTSSAPPTSQPILSPADAGCNNDETWMFTTLSGKEKNCFWVKSILKRCGRMGVANGQPKSAKDACPVFCGTCPELSIVQTGSPTESSSVPATLAPTAQPSKFPTSPPTLVLTAATTLRPSAQPNVEITKASTPLPTIQPIGYPTQKLTSSPSTSPSKQPAFRPSVARTLSPTKKHTPYPTGHPTLSPTPTSRPTGLPTAQPSFKLPQRPSLLLTQSPSFTLEDSPPGLPTDFPLEQTGGQSRICEDDAKWHHIDKRGNKKDCKWVKDRPGSRCEVIGEDISGNETSGNLSCRKACDNCSPVPSGTSLICEDDMDWVHTEENGSTRDCNWVKEYPEDRCKIYGRKDESGSETDGNTSCPKSCATCAAAPGVSTLTCLDDAAWRHVDKRGNEKDCKWVEDRPGGRCEVIGGDGSGNEMSGNLSCRKACNNCSPTPDSTPYLTPDPTPYPTPGPMPYATSDPTPYLTSVPRSSRTSGRKKGKKGQAL